MWVWTMASKYAGTRYFFGRKELTNLKKSTLNSYYKFLMDYQIPKKYHGKFNSKDNIITLPNMSEILLLDCSWNPSDPLYTRFGSLELTGGFIDESNEIQEQCITIISTRVGRHRNTEYKLKPKILETFNPDKGSVFLRYYKPRKAKELPPYRKFIPALVTDNKYIDPNYIEQLQKADQVTRQRLLFGNFEYDDTNNKLFRYDEVYDLFRSNIEKDNTMYISCDVARLGDDRTVICLWR
jgi:phage terminase large subunit